MFSDSLMQKVHEHYPYVQIKFKDQSLFMKLLGILFFFDRGFMTNYITTIGYNIYFPSEQWVNDRPRSSVMTLMHELTHVYDANRLTRLLFGFLYLMPISLLPFALLGFLVSWKLAIPLILLCLAPIPSYFRMVFEKRGYFTSLYATHAMAQKQNLVVDYQAEKTWYLSQFKGPYYYFMWPLPNLDAEFDSALAVVLAGQKPFSGPALDAVDDILTAA